MSELQRIKDICNKNGICTDCGQHWEHHLDEPFASCGCGTGEDTTLRSPYMQLQKRFYDYRHSQHKIVSLNGIEHLFIGYHPEQPVVILETPENEFITVSLGEYLKLEEV